MSYNGEDMVGMSKEEMHQQDREMMEHYRTALQHIVDGTGKPELIAEAALAEFLPHNQQANAPTG